MSQLSVPAQLNVLPFYVRGKAYHDDVLMPAHLERVKKFLESKNIMDLYPSAPGSEKKLKSNFGDLGFAQLQNQPSFFIAQIDSAAVEAGAVVGRVWGDVPARIAALKISNREARLAEPQEVADWFAEGERRKKEAMEAARRKEDAKRGALQELESLRERASLLEKIASLEGVIEKKGGK